MKIFVVTCLALTIAVVSGQGWGHWGHGHDHFGRPRPTTSSPPVVCKSQEDCQPEECCAHDLSLPYYLIGTESYSGICRPLGSENRACSTTYGKPETFGQVEAHFFCPCASGLTCKEAFNNLWGFKFSYGERCVADTPKEEEGSGEEEV